MGVNRVYKELNGSVCRNLNGITGKFCFPELITCLDTDDTGIMQSCDRPYCAIKCQGLEPDGDLPFLRGDKIMFQTQFRDLWNVDPKNPVDGWGDFITLKIFDAATDEEWNEENLLELFRHYVGHTGKNSFQVIEIDTGVEDFPCTFYIEFSDWEERITGYEDEEETLPIYELVEIDCRRTFNYKEVDPKDCVNTHTVEGIYTDFDCKGNYYGKVTNSVGDDFFKYSNATRIEAGLRNLSPNVTNEDNRATIIQRWSFTTLDANSFSGVFLPNYIIWWIANIFASKTVKIDGISYKISNFELEYGEQLQNSSAANFNWSVECSNCF